MRRRKRCTLSHVKLQTEISINGVSYEDESGATRNLPRVREECELRGTCSSCGEERVVGSFEDTTCRKCGSSLILNRPCPYVSCPHNLYLSVTYSGGIRLNYPSLQPWEVPPERSCVLDLAEERGRTLSEIGEIMRVSRERIRQVESGAFEKMRKEWKLCQLLEK